MKTRDKIAIFLFAINLLFYVLSGGGEAPRERIADQGSGQRTEDSRRPLPAPSVARPEVGTGPLVMLENEVKRQNSVGTAFPIDDERHYLTARHVIQGCRRVGLFTGTRKIRAAEVIAVHDRADIAILRATFDNARAYPFPLADQFEGNRTAFSIGYPSGKPGAVAVRYLGTVDLGHRGQLGGREPAVAWAVRSRIPRSLDAFGGISGGPMFAPDGTVVGISVAGNDRRGRLITSRPQTFQDLIKATGLQPRGTRPPNFQEQDYRDIAEDLIGTRRVAQVYCRVRT